MRHDRQRSPDSAVLSPGQVQRYLDRLGVGPVGAPTVETLFAIQRSHVERIPYENLDGHLFSERVLSMDTARSLEHVLGGRGGHCFQLNAVLGLLLRTLRYGVEHHWGHVRFGVEDVEPELDQLSGGHLALTVRAEGERWLVDAGLGDSLYEPLRLVQGTVHQAGLDLHLHRCGANGEGWRFVNDPRGSFVSMTFVDSPVSLEVFEPVLAGFPTASRLSRTPTVQQRHQRGSTVLRGRVLSRTVDGKLSRTLHRSLDEWLDCLEAVFGLTLPELSADQRAALWRRLAPGEHLALT